MGQRAESKEQRAKSREHGVEGEISGFGDGLFDL